MTPTTDNVQDAPQLANERKDGVAEDPIPVSVVTVPNPKAREALGEELGIALPEVTPAEAKQSAAFADAMRAASGAVPEPSRWGQRGLVNFGTRRDRGIYPRYYEVWDDLMKRCYDTVALHKPMNETGLIVKGEDRIDYSDTYSQQRWFSEDKAFEVVVKTSWDRPARKPRRVCLLQTNRFALVKRASVESLKQRFHDWWIETGRARDTVALTYPYKLHKTKKWYGGQTTFGSVQGCQLTVTMSHVTIMRETDAILTMMESEEGNCRAPAVDGSGRNIRINRLPRVRP